MICSIEGCTNNAVARTWCPKHYQRWAKWGDPTHTLTIQGNDVLRFWSKVDRRGLDDCWPWLGLVDNEGYPIFSAAYHNVKAHRYAWEQLVGPIPPKLEIDHTCHSLDNPNCMAGDTCLHRRCINVLRHMELVTHSVNMRRSHRKAPV